MPAQVPNMSLAYLHRVICIGIMNCAGFQLIRPFHRDMAARHLWWWGFHHRTFDRVQERREVDDSVQTIESWWFELHKSRCVLGAFYSSCIWIKNAPNKDLCSPLPPDTAYLCVSTENLGSVTTLVLKYYKIMKPGGCNYRGLARIPFLCIVVWCVVSCHIVPAKQRATARFLQLT